MQFYAGIGSRSTPQPIRLLMNCLALALGVEGWTLRSGGAAGADSAFEAGANEANRRTGGRMGGEVYLASPRSPEGPFDITTLPQWCFDVAREHHPAWERCSEYAQRLHARNVLQITGLHRQLSSFVLCWTPDGATTKATTSRDTGGTGQAIRIADAYGVPVFNLARQDHHDRLDAYVDLIRA